MRKTSLLMMTIDLARFISIGHSVENFTWLTKRALSPTKVAAIFLNAHFFSHQPPAFSNKDITKKTAVKAEATVVVNAENIGFKAGDVYQALAAAEKALNVKEIAKAAKISEEETLLGLGWLFKEGKLLSTEDNKIVLA